MPHFPPPPPSVYVMGTSVSNFRVSNDQVLDNLRVRQPNTMMVPPATPVLIDPNAPSSTVVPFVGPLVGNNDPDTNPSLRSGGAQAGALVYCTPPIANPLGPPFVPGPSGPTGPTGAVDPVDGCFDNRNHLYFSDGKNWIPLANCLENDGACVGPQYAEYSFYNNDNDTNYLAKWMGGLNLEDGDNYATIDCQEINQTVGLVSKCFEVTLRHGELGDDPGSDIKYTGAKELPVKVTASASWTLQDPQSPPSESGANVGMAIFVGDVIQTNMIQEAQLNDDNDDTGSPPISKPFPRNVTVSGFATLTENDTVEVRVVNLSSASAINVLELNLSVNSL